MPSDSLPRLAVEATPIIPRPDDAEPYEASDYANFGLLVHGVHPAVLTYWNCD